LVAAVLVPHHDLSVFNLDMKVALLFGGATFEMVKDEWR
jgi:hypothetical protein